MRGSLVSGRPEYLLAQISRAQNRSVPSVCNAFKGLIEARLEEPIRKVVAYEERTHYGGYCNTCSYEEAVIVVWYKDQQGRTYQTQFEDSFLGLVRQLCNLT